MDLTAGADTREMTGGGGGGGGREGEGRLAAGLVILIRGGGGGRVGAGEALGEGFGEGVVSAERAQFFILAILRKKTRKISLLKK